MKFTVMLPKEELEWIKSTGKVKLGKIINPTGISIKDPVNETYKDAAIAYVGTKEECTKAYRMAWAKFTLSRFQRR